MAFTDPNRVQIYNDYDTIKGLEDAIFKATNVKLTFRVDPKLLILNPSEVTKYLNDNLKTDGQTIGLWRKFLKMGLNGRVCYRGHKAIPAIQPNFITFHTVNGTTPAGNVLISNIIYT